MLNFEYQNPTKMIFGRGTHRKAGAQVKPCGRKVLLHYGGESIKRTGVYDQVTASLKEAGVEFVELGGVKPNPRLSLVHQGIELSRKEEIDFILAVGGGSAIDSAKAIAMGVPYQGEVWDFYTGKARCKEAVPLGTILTIPAAGSESSPDTVITNEETTRKYAASSPLLRPVFSILNPELCLTLPHAQIGYGVCDIMAHIMERYFTQTTRTDLIDRLSEATLRTVILNGRKLARESQDYDTWAEVMYASSIAHNGLLGTGRAQDWSSHVIEHELSAHYDIPHGAGLAIVFPAWIKHVYQARPEIFIQFAVRVWDVDLSFREPEEIIFEGVRRLEAFYKEMGLPTRLREVGIGADRLEEMAGKAVAGGPIGGLKKLAQEDVLAILKLALE
ncbi:MAG TPA: iron-containing alcohol dehydrogenase [bacterium]|nr:iron-containing alcohol dehydrogenase [bacterium]